MKTLSALEHLLQAANSMLSSECHAVPVWSIPGFYYDSAGHTEAKRIMEADAQAAYTAALAYRLTGEPVYAEKAKALLHGWATVNQEIAGHDGPLVSAYIGVGLIQAAAMIKEYPGWARADRDRFVGWVTRVCLPAWDSIPIRNNWWNWSLYAQLSLFYFMEDEARFVEEVAELKAHIDASFSPTGFVPEETKRGTNSIWYHYFTLAPTTAAAKLILDATGEDLFHWTSPSGNSIKKALDTLFHYADGRVEEWPYDKDQKFPSPLTSDSWPLDLFEAMSKVYGDPGYERFVAPYRPITGNRNINTGYYQSYSWIYPALQFRD